MEAKELRLNNLFIESKTNTVISVIGLTEEIITFSGHFKNDWQAEPIPLTEEWLLKFGWGKSNEHELCDNSNDIVFVYDWHFKRFEIQIDTEHVGVEYRLDHIKYVHQLQNLYFSLTNEELKLT
jgi:hypothetical protein